MRIILLLLVSFPLLGQMFPFPGPGLVHGMGAGFSVIDHQASSSNIVNLNTVGADIIILAVSVDAGASGGVGMGSVSDIVGGNGNTCWHQDLVQAVASHPGTVIWSCPHITFTGASDQITFGQAAAFPSVYAVSLSGTHSGAPLDTISGGTSTGTTIQPGAITPSCTNELVITSVATDQTTVPSVSGVTLLNTLGTIGGSNGGGMGEIIQSGIVTINPTWTVGSSTQTSGIAAYKSSSSVGGGC